MSFPKKIFAFDRAIFSIIAATAILTMVFGCKNEDKGDYAFAKATLEENPSSPTVVEKRVLSQEWKDYWYAGKAEITSYKLEQARYGELREGTAALIFVTENFLPKVQVKADRQNDSNIPVLKLNATKKFNTGIYPYSLMTSTFYPVQNHTHAIKLSHSMQEWCGQTYVQLNNRDNFEVQSNSYFEGLADQQKTLPKVVLENELWTQVRMDPAQLPTGDFTAIPDVAYIMMKHKELKAYPVLATLTSTSYALSYPSLDRVLTIYFSEEFPHTIEGWEETYKDGRNGEQMTSRAVKIKTIKSAYWGKNSNADAGLRDELGL